MKDIISVTDRLDENEYIEKLSDSKICVACWGYGEFVLMDFYAFYCGIVLIKPDTSHVLTYPDLYQNNITYVPCKPDFSDLETKIQMVLENYENFIPMLEQNRKMLMNIDETDLVERFCKAINESLN
jgi:hypothetical protein